MIKKIITSWAFYLILSFILISIGSLDIQPKLKEVFLMTGLIALALVPLTSILAMFKFPRLMIIYKGFHRPFPFMGRFDILDFNRSFSIKMKFALVGNWSYLVNDPEIINDYSKLIGFSIGPDHHECSHRIGFNFQNREVPLFCEYNYRHNINKITPIEADISKFDNLTVIYRYDHLSSKIFCFLFGGKGKEETALHVSISTKTASDKFGYLLGTYIGGYNKRTGKDWKSPKKLKIRLYNKVKPKYK